MRLPRQFLPRLLIFLGRDSSPFFTSAGQDHTAFGLATVALENRAVCRQTRCRLLLIGHLPFGEMTWWMQAEERGV